MCSMLVVIETPFNHFFAVTTFFIIFSSFMFASILWIARSFKSIWHLLCINEKKLHAIHSSIVFSWSVPLLTHQKRKKHTMYRIYIHIFTYRLLFVAHYCGGDFATCIIWFMAIYFVQIMLKSCGPSYSIPLKWMYPK